MKIILMNLCLVLALLSAAMANPGCATVAAYLPIAIAYAQDGALILDQIDRFVHGFFAVKPDVDLQKKVDVALARARSALDLALRAANGTQDLDQAKIDAAFAEFRAAYIDLLALAGPLGVHSGPGNHMGAAPGGGLLVPEPMALRR